QARPNSRDVWGCGGRAARDTPREPQASRDHPAGTRRRYPPRLERRGAFLPCGLALVFLSHAARLRETLARTGKTTRAAGAGRWGSGGGGWVGRTMEAAPAVSTTCLSTFSSASVAT